jgi:hypothetical protein
MWVRIHPNVYTHASTPSTWHRDQMAAVMWAQLAASSARAAAFLHGLPGFDDPPLEILTSCRKIVPRCGVIVHHTKRLPRDQILRVHSIPCTSVERTVLDPMWDRRDETGCDRYGSHPPPAPGVAWISDDLRHMGRRNFVLLADLDDHRARIAGARLDPFRWEPRSCRIC